MRRAAAALVLLCFAAAAQAELYRWIDPETGSVKFSSLPPYDARVRAEVITLPVPAQRSAPKPKPPAGQAAGASPPSAASPSADAPVSGLQSRFADLFRQLSGVGSQDFARGSEGLRQHVEAYEAVRAELDRLDPAGAERRRKESTGLLERLQQGITSQFSPLVPGAGK